MTPSPAPSPVVRPPALRDGDRVAVVSPSGPTRDRSLVEAGLRRLVLRGLRPELGAHALEARGFLAGDDASRLADLQAALDDPDVRAVFCLRGGYGVMRILDAIDWTGFRRAPKIIVGSSDATALLLAARRATGVVSIHAPMVATKDPAAFDPEAEDLLRRLLFEARPIGRLKTRPDDPSPIALRPGLAEGPLIGGNLALVVSLLGSSDAPDSDGAIVVLEDVNEAPYRVDRMLTQARRAGLFDRAAGVAFGSFVGSDAPPGTEATDLAFVLRTFAEAVAIPVVAGLPFGHRPRGWSLPIGGAARLDATDPKRAPELELLDSPTAVRGDA